MEANSLDQNKERFIQLCSNIHREGIKDLMTWLDSTDFYSAPASTIYHGAYPGGLLKHSLSVYDEFTRLLATYDEITCPDETSYVCPLFHDLCKANFYKPEKRNRKNDEGKWESYDAYKIDEQFVYGGHGSKSVYLIQHFMKLEPEEAVAINCHMGAFDNEYVGKSYERFPIAWLLHVADEAATYLIEGKGNK